MVKTLRLKAALQAEQTVFSFVGQLAALNFQPDTANFCADMDASFRAITKGDVEAIGRIAAVSGADLNQLLRASLLRRDDDLYLGDERMTKSTRLVRQIRFCPQCLLSDIKAAKAAGHRRPEIAAFGRREWLVSQVQTCRHHDLELVVVLTAFGTHQFDFAKSIMPLLSRLAFLVAEQPRRRATDFESYIGGRIEKRGETWLDTLGFSVALRLCEIVGVIIRRGRDAVYADLSSEELRLSGNAGYQILRDGVAAFRAFLSTLQDADNRHARDGANTDFGVLYSWCNAIGDPDIDQVLDVMHEHIVETTPVGAGQRVMGRVVKERKVHSVYTASREYKIDKAVLRAQLAVLGVISDDGAAYHHHLLFPAAPHHSLLMQLSRAVSAKDGMKRINCDRQVWPVLADRGFIKPLYEQAAAAQVFDPVALDAFVESLTSRAHAAASEKLLPISRAAKRAQVSQADIVDFIVSGKLTTIGQLPGQQGFGSIVVDPAEVLSLTAKPEIDGMVISKIAADLGVPHAGLVEMLDKQLPTEWRPYPKMRNQLQRVVDLDVYRTFKTRYISLRDVSRAAGLNGRQMHAQLKRKGILAEEGFPLKVHLYLRQHFS